jgi:hypothetical protein
MQVAGYLPGHRRHRAVLLDDKRRDAGPRFISRFARARNLERSRRRSNSAKTLR